MCIPVSNCFNNFFLASKVAAEKAGGGQKGAESAASSSLFGMSLDEAKQILNVNNIEDAEKLAKVYRSLFLKLFNSDKILK